MRDDEEANAALIEMGQTLTRSQLDASFPRENLRGVVESCFNDPFLRYFLDMTGRVDGVDSRLPRAACRTTSFLKNKVNNNKGNFTTYLHRSSASGQNDPYRFGRYIPKLPSGELNASGKRMMIMFSATKKGTPSDDGAFTNLFGKHIPGGAERDEGSRTEYTRTEGRPSSLGTRGGSGSQELLNAMTTSISKMASCYVER